MFLQERAYVIGRLEATPYTPESPGSTDFTLEVEGLDYSSEIASLKRKVADGTLDSYKSVMGAQSGTVKFFTYLNPGATADVLPTWDKFLRACGYKRTEYNGTSGTITTVAWQSGTTVRYTFSGTPDLSGVNVGSILEVSGCAETTNNGSFVVTAVNDTNDTIDVDNPLRTDGTDDESGLSATGEYTHTGMAWVPHADYTHIPMTLLGCEIDHTTTTSVLETKMGGCMGNVTFEIGDVGEPTKMSFEFKGSLESISDQTTDSVGTVSTVQPPAVLSSTVTVGGTAQCLSKYKVDTGNQVEHWKCQSEATGIRGAYIAKRATTLTMDSLAALLAADPVYTQWLAGTTGAVSISYSSSPLITLSAPVAQYVSVGRGNRGEATTAEKTFDLHKSSGNDCFEILIGTKS